MNGRRIATRARSALSLLACLGAATALPLSTPSNADNSERIDGCEQEALRAYAEVLKICRLAETDNPRLRCFEAARSVYFQTLENCRRSHDAESPRNPSTHALKPPPQ